MLPVATNPTIGVGVAVAVDVVVGVAVDVTVTVGVAVTDAVEVAVDLAGTVGVAVDPAGTVAVAVAGPSMWWSLLQSDLPSSWQSELPLRLPASGRPTLPTEAAPARVLDPVDRPSFSVPDRSVTLTTFVATRVPSGSLLHLNADEIVLIQTTERVEYPSQVDDVANRCATVV